jgi:hypothetical protein
MPELSLEIAMTIYIFVNGDTSNRVNRSTTSPGDESEGKI